MKRAMSLPPPPLTPPHVCVCVSVRVCWGIRKHLPIHTAPLHMHIRIRDDDSQTIFIGKLYLFLLPKAKAECEQGESGVGVGGSWGKFQHQQHFGRIYTRIAVRASVCQWQWQWHFSCSSVSRFVPVPLLHKVNGLRLLGSNV